MSVQKHYLSFLAILIAWLVFAAGCRAAPPLPAQPSPPAGTPTTGPISLVLWHSETGAARAELEALARDFHTAYPDLTVTPIYVGSADDLEKQVTAAIALSRTPDLVLASRRDLAQFIRQDGLLPLDSLRDDPTLGLSAEDRADLFPGLLDEGTFVEFGKQFYAFPFDLEALVLFYNTHLIAKPPTTWNDFADQASKATKDQQYGWPMEFDADVFSAMLVSQGSAMIDDPERRTLFAERGGVASMMLASQLYKSGVAKVKGDSAAALKDFAQGQVAFYFGWMSQLPALQAAQKAANTDFEIGVANLPQGDPTEPYLLSRGNDLAIFKIAPERARNAWFFIRWLTASEQTARWTRAANAIPLRASALNLLSDEAAKNARWRQIQNSFNGQAPHLVPSSANRHAGQIERLMGNAWSQIVMEKTDPAMTLTTASLNANQLLAGNR